MELKKRRKISGWIILIVIVVVIIVDGILIYNHLRAPEEKVTEPFSLDVGKEPKESTEPEEYAVPEGEKGARPTISKGVAEGGAAGSGSGGGGGGGAGGSGSGGGTPTYKTDLTICTNAQNSDICGGLDIAYGDGYEAACCSERGLCC